MDMSATSAQHSPCRHTELRSIPSTPFNSRITLVRIYFLKLCTIVYVISWFLLRMRNWQAYLNELKYAAGYPSWKGQVLQADQIWSIYEGLVENKLDYYSHVLTGTHLVAWKPCFFATESSMSFVAPVLDKFWLSALNTSLIRLRQQSRYSRDYRQDCEGTKGEKSQS